MMAMTWQEHARQLGIDPARLEPPPRPPTPQEDPAAAVYASALASAAATESGPSKSKYRNRRTPYNGRTYASRAEAKRAMQLDLLVTGGIVRWWMPQPVVLLGDAWVKYTPDFLVVTPDGWHFEDVKGVATKRFGVIVQLWKVHGPAPLHVIYPKRTEVIAGASDGGASS